MSEHNQTEAERQFAFVEREYEAVLAEARGEPDPIYEAVAEYIGRTQAKIDACTSDDEKMEVAFKNLGVVSGGVLAYIIRIFPDAENFERARGIVAYDAKHWTPRSHQGD